MPYVRFREARPRTNHAGRSGQLTEPQKFPPEIETASIVQIKNPDGSAPRRSQALKICAPEREVVSPSVAPRVKQHLHLTRQRVDSTQVGTLMKVAPMASQREVADIVATSVLPGDHMFNMV